MMSRKISCSILTPERSLFEGDVDFVIVQAHNGEMGFLINHAPLISELGVGEIRLREGKSTEYLVVEGGVVEIKDNRLIILAESAMKKSELDPQEIEAKLKELTELKDKEYAKFSNERYLIQLEQEKFKARLKVAMK
ncbi:MAG: ATP synthase F1 subunit epsilon [Spirochaetes bacterium]|jgi:F-type H+-transporting ATPase subunit epsilon|nr:ATP synthase F1 subunit epsilon [Spirochaetota bacterium]